MSIAATSNKELMAHAREALRGKWGVIIGAGFVYLILAIVISLIGEVHPALNTIVNIFFVNVLVVGYIVIGLTIIRGGMPNLNMLFCGFKQSYFTIVIASVLMPIFIFLWTLLFIIPGIIAAFSYFLTLYLIADNPNMSATEAIGASKELMKGNKMQLFCLGLRFFGWSILCMLTAGIGFIWLIPYMQVSYCAFYQDIIEQDDESFEDAEVEIEVEA